jgi:hypothetical protein
MIYTEPPAPFKWSDLHGKILKIAVAQPNPDVLEFTGQVFGIDVETGKTYVLAEFTEDKARGSSDD